MGDDDTTLYPDPPRDGARGVACLLVVAGSSAGRRVDLRHEEVVIGRDPEVGLRLTDSGISRRHARLLIGGDGNVNLIDMGSRNGTYVNGARVELAALQDGDRIQIGRDAVLRMSYETGAQPVKGRAPRGTALTKRELDVARLVARGLTNPQIAERLAIKLRTVTTHLDHIYSRLHLNTRTALTRFVIEARLLEPEGEG